MRHNLIISYLLFIVFSKASFSLNNIDSLTQLLLKETNEIAQIDLLIEISKENFYTNFESALSSAKTAANIIKHSAEPEKLLKKQCTVENLIGASYLNLGKLDLSLEHFLISLKTAEIIKDTASLSKANNNLGMIYGYKGEFEKSNQFFIKSAQYAEQLNNIDGAAIAYSNVSASYYDLGIPEKGDYYYNKALDLYKKIKDDYGIASLYLIKGNEYLKNKQYNKALKFYDLAESIYKNLGTIESLMDVYQNKANLYARVNKRDESITYNKKNLELAKQLNSPMSISLAYQGLSAIYELKGNMGKALKNYKLFIAWKDSVFNEKSESVIAEMQAKYNYEKEERENKILKQQASISKLEIENKQKQLNSSRIIITSIIIGSFLLILLAFLLYKKNKLKEETNKKLIEVNNQISLAKQIIEEKNKEITDSIEYAKYIQQAILPKKETIKECFKDTLLILLPKDVVSGDFYWFLKFGKYSVIVLADCTGHGVPGGFMSMMGVELLNQVLSDPSIVEAGKVLEKIDERIKNNLNKKGSKRQQNDGMDIAICIFNKGENILQYAGANSPLIFIRDKKLQRIAPDKYGVGGAHELNKTFKTHYIDIKSDDTFYMYSDGFPDQFGGPKNKKFMRKRLLNLFLEISNKPMAEQEKLLLKEFYNWKGNVEQVDDVSVVGIKI